MATEFQRIARLASTFGLHQSDRVVVGIGDDAAVLAPSPRRSVWTVDTAVEGVHFSRAFMALEDIGYRAFMAAASDVAAMGARATGALCAWVLPPDVDDDAFDRLAQGIARAATDCACPVIGGNLARGREFSLTTTVLGECLGPVLLRSGARMGDTLFVTGTVGGAALALQALLGRRAEEAVFRDLLPLFLEPKARLDLAEAVAQRARACIDISDGLVQDLGHLCQSSNVSAVVHIEAVPVPDGLRAAAALLGQAPNSLVLAGGEDYQLLFAANPTRVPRELATPIGRIEAGPPLVRVLDAQGQAVPLPAGFDHFR